MNVVQEWCPAAEKRAASAGQKTEYTLLLYHKTAEKAISYSEKNASQKLRAGVPGTASPQAF